ncbi:MAG: cytochrome c maturation protein CcmE [Phototrophicales bacterium]|nr:cytochrome c maturation protein CcmE [Phototrophicales bacterium]
MTDITLNPEASPTWEKTPATSATKSNKSWQFMVGFALIMGAVAFLILGNTLGGAQYFTTVQTLKSDPEAYIGKTIRISGAVVGETIQYDTNTLDISFTIAHIPESADNVGEALFIAANDANAVRLQVFVANTVKPDLLRHEAQAILTGYLGDDGVFYANELLLKCPSRFEDGANPLSVTH